MRKKTGVKSVIHRWITKKRRKNAKKNNSPFVTRNAQIEGKNENEIVTETENG